jgi:hypothetical protein
MSQLFQGTIRVPMNVIAALFLRKLCSCATTVVSSWAWLKTLPPEHIAMTNSTLDMMGIQIMQPTKFCNQYKRDMALQFGPHVNPLFESTVNIFRPVQPFF